MFISVSNTLPTTAYVRMVDIWLIFSLTIPFLEVLLHIYMNYYKNDTDREVNHHDKTIDVGKNEGNTSKVIPVKGKRSVELSLTHHTNTSCWAGNLSKAEVETDKILVKLFEFSGSIDNISPDESQFMLAIIGVHWISMLLSGR